MAKDKDVIQDVRIDNEIEWRKYMMSEIKEIKAEIKGLRVITGTISAVVSGGVALIGYLKGKH